MSGSSVYINCSSMSQEDLVMKRASSACTHNSEINGAKCLLSPGHCFEHRTFQSGRRRSAAMALRPSIPLPTQLVLSSSSYAAAIESVR